MTSQIGLQPYLNITLFILFIIVLIVGSLVNRGGNNTSKPYTSVMKIVNGVLEIKEGPRWGLIGLLLVSSALPSIFGQIYRNQREVEGAKKLEGDGAFIEIHILLLVTALFFIFLNIYVEGIKKGEIDKDTTSGNWKVLDGRTKWSLVIIGLSIVCVSDLSISTMLGFSLVFLGACLPAIVTLWTKKVK